MNYNDVLQEAEVAQIEALVKKEEEEWLQRNVPEQEAQLPYLKQDTFGQRQEEANGASNILPHEQPVVDSRSAFELPVDDFVEEHVPLGQDFMGIGGNNNNELDAQPSWT